ncbi:MAG: serine/threonine-protein kinase [Phycisphaerae bacterium]
MSPPPTSPDPHAADPRDDAPHGASGSAGGSGSRLDDTTPPPVSDAPLAPHETQLDSQLERDPLRTAAYESRGGSGGSRVDHGLFLPGTMLAGRYRVIELLGRGGMGQVFRAEDLKLHEIVALKFLMTAREADPHHLQAMYNEVRVARQVAHANVCRVYDIGEIDGRTFISMEYIDGEHLGSLLRRIGRLPTDKAIDIARQLALGLAAIHHADVLHRDLKPTNIMIDGRGRVRITDFGLAGLAHELARTGERAGTPAYMAPEQIAGRGVSVRSDVYSFGLVLYELFTGRQAFHANSWAEFEKLQLEHTPREPSALVGDLDPAIERTILRCLEKDAHRRPATALEIAAALPGSDPLAAALAAGETPSPDVVAASADQTLSAPIGMALLMIAWVGLAGYVAVSASLRLVNLLPLDHEPRVLAARARELVERVGHVAPRHDHAYGVAWDEPYVERIYRGEGDETWDDLRAARPPGLGFWYRESPVALNPRNEYAIVTVDDPAPVNSGMVSVQLDWQGRLRYLHAVPFTTEAANPTGQTDWSTLFALAGLPLEEFEESSPLRVPPAFCDQRAAWTGAYPENADHPVRVEAGLYRGRPVYFEIVEPWQAERVTEPPAGEMSLYQRVLNGMVIGAVGGALLVGLLLARRNVRFDRGDRRGALRAALFMFVVHAATPLVVGKHSLDWYAEADLIYRACSYAALQAALLWIAYLAVEPYVRRRWPQTLVSWTRLVAGRWRDARVGRDVLIGIAGGVLWLWFSLVPFLNEWAAGRDAPPCYAHETEQEYMLLGPRLWVGRLLNESTDGVMGGMLMLLMLFVLRTLLRRDWIAGVAFVGIFAIPVTVGNLAGGEYLTILISLVAFTLLVVALLRYGLLCVMVATFVLGMGKGYPLTTDVNAWYAGATAFPVAVLALLALGAFHISRGGRPLLSAKLLDA